jgi:hypothetical protein
LLELGYRRYGKLSKPDCACRASDLIIDDERLAQGFGGLAVVDSICSTQELATVFISADPPDLMRSMVYAVLLEKPFSAAVLVDPIKRALLQMTVSTPPAGAA